MSDMFDPPDAPEPDTRPCEGCWRTVILDEYHGHPCAYCERCGKFVGGCCLSDVDNYCVKCEQETRESEER